MKCPKCAHERTASDSGPDYECPKCGVVYAKYTGTEQSNVRREPAMPRVSARPSSFAADIAPGGDVESSDAKPSFYSAWSQGVLERIGTAKLPLVVALAVGLFVGYFAGREHLKYEIRSAFGEAATSLAKNLSGIVSGEASKPAPKPSKPVTQSAKTTVFSAMLKSKGFLEGKYGQDEITFAIEFDNKTGRDVRAFDGVLTFTDLLGNELISSKLAVNDPVATGTSVLWRGKLDYNQFIDRHRNLRSAEQENTKVVFTVQKVLFADGETKEY